MEADALWKSLRDFNERLENPPKTPGFPQLPQDPPLDLAREIKERDNYPDTGGMCNNGSYSSTWIFLIYTEACGIHHSVIGGVTETPLA
jgi:hypothetical protein